MKHILYIQYANPAAYPPLQHSSRMLADAGWKVTFLGTRSASDNLSFAPHQLIETRYMNFCPGGWRQKFHYLTFCVLVVFWALRSRARWIYASDPLVCPAAVVARALPWIRLLYHEHDSPNCAEPGGFQRMVRWARSQIARRADVCVLPNEGRLKNFREETKTDRPVFSVWNCPSNREVGSARNELGSLELYYHGALGPDYVPAALMKAISQFPNLVRLRVIGYETIGGLGFAQRILTQARELGIDDRVEISPALPRFKLLEECRHADVGLAFTPIRTEDINHRSRVGASNKPFDYMACGLPLLVSDLPDWREAYVNPGYAIACDPQDAGSIAASIRRLLDEPGLARLMGERGRQKIISDWNYETCFQPVLRFLES